MLFKNVIRLIILLSVQLLILNNIYLGGVLNPLLYALFIIKLPYITKGWVLLLTAFGVGLIMDVFCNTPGLHTAALVAMAFSRPFILKIYTPRRDFNASDEPSAKDSGIMNYLLISFLLLVVHHFVFFFLEIFRFAEFYSTLLRSISSVFLTLILVIISEFLFFRPKT